jgi:uncharacterized protein YegL
VEEQMTYTGEISRDHPTCFLFVIDQSGSMDEKMGSRSKADFVADVLNKTLATLVANCTKADGVRSYFDIGVIAYGGNGVISGLSGDLIQPISKIWERPLRVEERTKKSDDGAGGIIDQRIKFPVWFDPTSSGGTPMCAALTKAAEAVVEWCDAHPASYPPTILHITDGQSTDGNPEQIADGICQISTQDGTCLLFNLHVTTSEGREVLFPSSEQGLADEYSRMLFRMSSELPSHLSRFASGKDYPVGDGARGFIFNGNPQCIVDFFEIGTRPRLISER